MKTISLRVAIGACLATAAIVALGAHLWYNPRATSAESHQVYNFITDNGLAGHWERQFNEINDKWPPSKRDLAMLLLDANSEVQMQRRDALTKQVEAIAAQRPKEKTVEEMTAETQVMLSQLAYYRQANGKVRGIQELVMKELATFGPCQKDSFRKTSIGLTAMCLNGRWTTPPIVVVFPGLEKDLQAFAPVVYPAEPPSKSISSKTSQ